MIVILTLIPVKIRLHFSNSRKSSVESKDFFLPRKNGRLGFFLKRERKEKMVSSNLPSNRQNFDLHFRDWFQDRPSTSGHRRSNLPFLPLRFETNSCTERRKRKERVLCTRRVCRSRWWNDGLRSCGECWIAEHFVWPWCETIDLTKCNRWHPTVVRTTPQTYSRPLNHRSWQRSHCDPRWSAYVDGWCHFHGKQIFWIIDPNVDRPRRNWEDKWVDWTEVSFAGNRYLSPIRTRDNVVWEEE